MSGARGLIPAGMQIGAIAWATLLAAGLLLVVDGQRPPSAEAAGAADYFKSQG